MLPSMFPYGPVEAVMAVPSATGIREYIRCWSEQPGTVADQKKKLRRKKGDTIQIVSP